MKKLWVLVFAAVLLAGCSSQKALETVNDVQEVTVTAVMQQPLVQLPPELSTPVLQSEEAGTLYLCDDYAVTVHTVEAGDLRQTIQNITGMDMENLQILRTMQGTAQRYQWVWTANGESGIQVGRGCILDDGAYHYVLTALAEEAVSGQVWPAWKEIFASFRLAASGEDISTGS